MQNLLIVVEDGDALGHHNQGLARGKLLEELFAGCLGRGGLNDQPEVISDVDGLPLGFVLALGQCVQLLLLGKDVLEVIGNLGVEGGVKASDPVEGGPILIPISFLFAMSFAEKTMMQTLF